MSDYDHRRNEIERGGGWATTRSRRNEINREAWRKPPWTQRVLGDGGDRGEGGMRVKIIGSAH